MNTLQAKQVLSTIFDAPTAYDQDVMAALETITIDKLVSSLSKWHGRIGNCFDSLQAIE